MGNCQCGRGNSGARRRATGVGHQGQSVNSNALCLTPDACPGLIIWRRDSDTSAKPASAAAANSRGRDSCRRWYGVARIRSGLCRLPDSSRGRPEGVWIGGRASLHRRAAEERKDDFNLRSAAALDLRELSVPASGMVALLVSEPASRSADGYLIVERRSSNCGVLRRPHPVPPPRQNKWPAWCQRS